MTKKPTLHRVAKLAGVSPATVTRVAAGNRAVDADIRDRVYRAAAKLGMNLDERRHSKSRILGFLLANRDVLHSFQARVLLGAERYCAQHQWRQSDYVSAFWNVVDWGEVGRRYEAARDAASQRRCHQPQPA